MELPKYFYFRLHPAKKGTAVEIEDASDADVIEVVRCKDCKHSYDDIGGSFCSFGVCVDCIVDPDFYCANAERRTDE